MNEPLADAAARAAALDPTRSFIVEAAAGSGKTALLTQRFLVLLARVKAPEEIVAITFTRKAAAEMRGRVLAALALAQAPDDPDPQRAATQALACAVMRNDREFGWQLIANPIRLRIETIDALTASLVRRLPLLAGLPATLGVREDASELYRRAARRALLEAEEPQSPWGRAVTVVLRDLDNDWRRMERLLVEMLARRDQWLPIVINAPGRASLEAALAQTVRADAARLSAQCPPDLKARLVDYARWAGRTLEVRDPDNPRVALSEFAGSADDVDRWPLLAGLLFTQSGKPRAQLDKRTGLPSPTTEAAPFKALHAALIEALSTLPAWTAALLASLQWPPTVYSEREFARLAALLTTLRLLAAHWRVVSNEVGATDFADIALAALTVLGEPDNPTDLGLAVDYQIAHLLIDEFQDTSRTQYQLLERLTAGWGNDGRTLFVVGDPLQSIYRFRDADVGRFTRTVREACFGTIALTALRLHANFRTSTTVIDWLNHAFSAVFAGSSLDEPQFYPITATCADRSGTEIAVHVTDTATQTAQVIAAVIAIRQRDPNATIAILVRGRSHLSGLLPALLDAGVPVAATAIEPLHQIPVVNDLVALTRALYLLTDRIAWLAILRAPWCGLSLADLAALVGEDRDRLVWDLMTDPVCAARVAPAERSRLDSIAAQLAVALAARGRLDYVSLVSRTWQALNGPACDVNAARYASRYFELLGQLESDGRELTAAVLRTEVADHFAPLSASSEAQVQIMTIHHAKGLEFDYVLLPELQRPVRVESRALLLGQGAEPSVVLAPIPATGKSVEPIYEYLRAREQRALRAETHRVLYVALTRARVALHLFAVTPPPKGPRPGTFLQLLWPVVGSHTLTISGAPPLVSAGRLRGGGRLPPAAVAPLPQDIEWTRSQSPPLLEFAWASPLAKHIGTVTHAMLQDYARTERGDPSRTSRARLRALGVTSPALERAVDEVLATLTSTVNSDRGRWLLSADHLDAHSEYRLTTLTDRRAVDVVVDRTFVDSSGVRWIIDYKTGSHLGGDRDAFMDSEVIRYRAQLEGYAEVFRRLETRPIRLALYFPRLDGWREWAAGEAAIQ